MGVRDGLAQRAIGVGEVAQDHPFGPGQLVAGDEVGEAHRLLPHRPHDGLRGERVVRQPRVGLPIGLVCRPQQLRERLRPEHLVERVHALLVLHAVGLHLGDRLAARLPLLGQEHGPGRVEDRLDHRHDVEGVGRGRRVEQFQRGEGEVGQRLVKGEVLGQLDGEGQGASLGVGLGQPDDDPGVEQAASEPNRPARQSSPSADVLMVVTREPRQRSHRVARTGDDVEDHRVVDPHPGRERLGRGRDELVEGRLVPDDLAGLGLDPLDPFELDRVVARLGDSTGVLDEVLGGLDDDLTHGVVASATGSPGDLVELASPKEPLPRAVKLHQPGEQHGTDRDVDADAQGVGPADDLEQAGLRELLDDPPIARQHPRVMDANSLAQQG